jgi:pimeloyl-ACP methyl ester carboxylesterase
VTELAAVFPRHRTVRVREVDTYVAEAGPSDAAPILLLHGNPDSHTVWSGVVARLAERHRCIAPDLPGWGRSVAPRDFDCSLPAHAAYVRDLVAALGLERFHLVVHDVGANYGLAYATEHAAALRSLAIFNANFFPDYRWHFWARIWRTRVLGEIAMAIANRPLFVREMKRGSPKLTTEYARHAYSDFTRSTKRMVLRWYRAADPALLAGWDTRLVAATARTPKQVIWGDRDPFIKPATADRFGAPVERFPDCGHWVMVEEPERAAAAIAKLVDAAQP